MQIGSSSLFNLALGAGILLPGMLAPVWWAVLLEVGGPLGMNVGMAIPFLLVGLAIGALRRALRRRASDLVIDQTGVRIEGGRLHGLSFEVKELRAESWRVKPRGKLAVLEIDLPGASEMLLAETTDARERQAFEDVVATIRATFSSAEQGRTEAGSPHVIQCQSCGGEAVPDARPSVPCRYCQKPVTMPPEVRSKLEQAVQRKRELGRSRALLDQLLRQPAVTSTNRLLVWVGAIMLLVWPAVIAVSLARLHAGTLSEQRALVLFALPLPLILGLFLAAAWRLVDRQALQLVTLGMGAEPPRRDGEPHHCRACGGPLPADNEILVECLFCDAQNVLGFDLRHALGKARIQVASLEQALRARRSRRLAWAWPAAIGAVLTLAAGYALVSTARAGIEEVASSSEPERLNVCVRFGLDPSVVPSDPYYCGQSLDRSDRVLGSELDLLLSGPASQDSWRYMVRRVAPGENPKLATDGVPLAPGDDYADFVVRKDGGAYLYVDGFYARRSAAPSADGGPD
jgi:hypothetical protein